MDNDGIHLTIDRDYDKVKVTFKVSGEYTEYVTHTMDYADLHKFYLFVDNFNSSINNVSLKIISVD